MKKILISMVMFLSVVNVYASPIVLNLPENFSGDPGSGAADWQVSGGDAFIDNSGANSLTINLGTGVNPDVYVFAQEAAPSSSSGRFTGNMLGVGSDLNVKFQLKSVTEPNPNDNSLVLYFIGGLDNNKWVIEMNQPTISGVFQDYSRNIGNMAIWTKSPSNPLADFNDDFASVSEFGFEFLGAANNIYELTDVELTVPEPETVWMILMVLASLGITFRSRLMELAGQVKARIRA